MRITALCLMGAAIAAITTAGCGSAEPSTSTIKGTIDQSTFPIKVEKIVVISDSSAPTSAPVAEDGSFTLTLLEGASYRFSLAEEGSLPLVLRTDDDRLQTSVKITGGGATADIGSVRFWMGKPSDSTAQVQGEPSTTASPTRGECVDGLIVGSSEPCATGEAEASCDGAEEGSGHHRGFHPGGGHPPHHGDGDEATPVTSDPATDASPEQPVAIPTRSLATGIGCGGCPGM